jgi:hypothetical protein
MGIFDDAGSVISAHTSHSKRSKSHRSSRHSHKDRSRERSRSRHRSSRSNAGGIGAGISGIAASIFGGDDDDNDGHKSDRRRRSHRERDRQRDTSDDDGTRSFFGLGNGSKSSFFSNFGMPPPLVPLTPVPTNPPCPPLGGGGKHTPTGASYYRRSPRPGFVSRLLKKLKRLLRDLLYYAKRHPTKVFMLVLMPLITGGALTALLARFGLRLPPFLERMLGLAARAGGGDSMGLVGEAVRMVSGAAAGVGSAGVARASVERGREGGMQWYVSFFFFNLLFFCGDMT